MTISADTLRKLAALRLAPEQMAGVLDVLADIQSVDEARLEKQRDRVRRHRENRFSNVTETSQKRDTPTPDKEKSPTPPKEINPTPETSLRSEAQAPRKRAHRMPNDYQPDLDFAVAEGLTLSEAKTEAANIRDWSMSSPSGAKLDWDATWRGWVRRAVKAKPQMRQPSQAPPRPSSPFMQRQDAIHQKLKRDLYGEPDDQFASDHPTLDLAARDFRAH